MAKLDHATRRLLGEVSEYRQMIQGMSHSPVSKEVAEALETVEEGIRHSSLPEALSPGQREAVEVAGSALDDLTIEEEPLSPGERQVSELSGN